MERFGPTMREPEGETSLEHPVAGGGSLPEREWARQIVREHWQRRAATYDAHPHHAVHSEAQHWAWLQRLSAWAGEQTLDVLDMGCGTGLLALLLAQPGHTVTGLDLSSALVIRFRFVTRRQASGSLSSSASP